MSKDEHRALKIEPYESTADPAEGRDTPEQTDSSENDSREHASRHQRTQIGAGSSTRIDALRGDNGDVALPLSPSRANSGRHCELVEADVGLPEHIMPCTCSTHDGVCEVCHYKITIGPSGREYGHARLSNSVVWVDGDRRDCPHRPAECDPGGPRTEAPWRVMTDGGLDYDDVSYVISSGYRQSVIEELHNRPQTPSEIDARTVHDISNVSRALKELTDRGLTELLVSEDRRKGRIYGLTGNGEAVAEYVAERGEVMTDGGTQELPARNADTLDQRYQVAGKLRCLADTVEQHGRIIDQDDVDVHVRDGEATVVATFDLEDPAAVQQGGDR